MGNALNREENLAPLAFQMSVHSEKMDAALQKNYIDTSDMRWHPLLAGCFAFGVCAGLLVLFSVPMVLSATLALIPGYFADKVVKRYYLSDYADGRIEANRQLIAKNFDENDASTLANIAQSIVNSHFGSQRWAVDLRAKRSQGLCNDYQYLGGVHAYAPNCWRLCAAKVYEMHAVAVDVH
ncbi:hypothetical protein [Pseudomonas syringae]|uniref:hypothetical protein n=1 Tax=Pseudomonas syringae TaxID=317 RepID=UPI001F2A0396|nr:hypothetical protein [Pseudomonas syringae]MCF5371232.1 hypothetical protein [Pseudomonas syringae]MCF5381917.1 hypothetical protein [Pseudomonas syringae]MCF5424033.1 hypothetical protein [Pseudomonas syringae]MCF5454932.1 hypothetical protein [Pseudomonas syringae]MCF5459244.1 hypothetical protein [Pseudomonas syringae]